VRLRSVIEELPLASFPAKTPPIRNSWSQR
jgi:hypothetical protein